MANVLISTAPGTEPGNACHLDAAWAANQPVNSAVLVRLSKFGVVRNNDMNWELSRVDGSPRIAPLMWFRDAGTLNVTGPKVLQLQQEGDGMAVVVQGDEQNQPPPAVTSWKVTAMPSTGVRALAVTISQTIGGQEWFLQNEGLVPDESPAKASRAPTSWYVQPSALVPGNLGDFLETVVDGPADSLKAGDAILRMWNGIANSHWNTSLAPTLLAWLYDFSKMFLQPNATDPFDKAALERTLYGQLYNRTPEYKAYFDSFAPGETPEEPPPGFGSGDPPPAPPPQPPGPHRHPRHK